VRHAWNKLVHEKREEETLGKLGENLWPWYVCRYGRAIARGHRIRAACRCDSIARHNQTAE